MIYDLPGEDEPIRQGDIFARLPRLDFSLTHLQVLLSDQHVEEITWDQVAETGDPITAIVSARPVTAIVATQDCDALRAPDITLCEIRPFRDVEHKAQQTTAPKSWVSLITQHARITLKWFYLPPDPKVGFEDKMAVDFMVTLRVPRLDLEGFRHLRRGRLNDYAEAHFRERIGQFFRRYPYDEWYALSPQELQAYTVEHTGTQPYPWQSG
jgi:hypothetical protein